MKTKQIIFSLLFSFTFSALSAQHLALSINDAEKQGLSIAHLDSIYRSAIHADSTQAVFKTERQQEAMYEAYVKLLKDLGKFLSANNFQWEKPTKSFNRIYFSTDGTIDYFLYNFLASTDQLSQEKQTEFNRLLNKFIQDYKISVKANSKFAQCSPTTYMPKDLK